MSLYLKKAEWVYWERKKLYATPVYSLRFRFHKSLLDLVLQVQKIQENNRLKKNAMYGLDLVHLVNPGLKNMLTSNPLTQGTLILPPFSYSQASTFTHICTLARWITLFFSYILSDLKDVFADSESVEFQVLKTRILAESWVGRGCGVDVMIQLHPSFPKSIHQCIRPSTESNPVV